MPDELYTQLRRLLGDMFSMDELHRFLRGHLGKPFTDSLPEKGVSSAAYAAQAADRLITRRLLTDEFLEAWVETRPQRESEIRALQHLGQRAQGGGAGTV